MKHEQHLDEEPHSSCQEADSVAVGTSTPTQNERRRWHVINLLNDGVSLTEIVTATGYQPRTIRRIAQRYKEAGAAGLVDGRRHSAGAIPLLSTEQQHELREALHHPPPDGKAWTGAKVADWIAAKIGRPVRRQRGWEYLRRLEAEPSPSTPSTDSSLADV